MKDYKRYYQSEYTQIGELDKLVAECREMALKLGFMLSWRPKLRTAKAFIKFNGHILWQGEYTDKFPHRLLLQMYCGVHAELTRRDEENTQAILRMRKYEEERAEERAAANLQSWAERNKQRG